MESKPPRVFLSYSDDSASHDERMRKLAQSLRIAGIDARIDQFEDVAEDDWAPWFEAQVRDADFVLVACTPTYKARCEGASPRGPGTGSHLSFEELRDAEDRHRKFIPVLFDDDELGACVPSPLRGHPCYRLPSERDRLHRRLSDQPPARAAALGALRTYDDDSLETSDFESFDGLSSGVRRAEVLASPEDSLQALTATGLLTPKARPKAVTWPRWLGAGAAGLAVVATVMFVKDKLGDPQDGSTCRIELSDPSGAVVDNIRAASLELPSGDSLAVTVDDGGTLTFACPESAVNARLRVERGVERGPRAPDTGGASPFVESDIRLSPTPGLRTIPLEPPR